MKISLNQTETLKAIGDYAAKKAKLKVGDYNVSVELDIVTCTGKPDRATAEVEITPKIISK